ncbi:alanine racemase [Schizosaccharomyces octosporus yFS286]|uniref:D-serine dehydratase n=1 Tax=Schizosaccharomyces octosporus (strain yFS286) TaxID=483514 RepID=S9QZM2_SCHOY|nr:alanine racemase [Schizosaccharomyces octosporus yFS286]EPX71700.1 alanine racemase [Schizosaccharomyces octosporus yFS286]
MSYINKFSSRYYLNVDKQELKRAYVGKTVQQVPTPGFFIDRNKFSQNCNRMLDRAEKIGVSFRAHVKTHKTSEGTLLQLGDGKTKAVVVSTLMEAFSLIPLIQEGKINDLLYGLPVANSRLSELYELTKIIPHLRLMIDHPKQLQLLREFSSKIPNIKAWSIFVKIDMGTHRAGVDNKSNVVKDLVSEVLSSKTLFSLYGFYCHAGHSYASTSIDAAVGFLYDEIQAANVAAGFAVSIEPSLRLTLSVGATPTAHSVNPKVKELLPSLHGELELHAGNYPMNDIQQMITNCISKDDVSAYVVAEVLSNYAGRNGEPGEALMNAGVIAMSRETSPKGGHGIVITPGFESFYVDRLSQEHGILKSKNPTAVLPEPSQYLSIIPNHSCITAAAYPWYYITEGSNIITDIWVPWKGW